MQMLADLTQSFGFLLSREISLGVSKAMESEKRAHEVGAECLSP